MGKGELFDYFAIYPFCLDLKNLRMEPRTKSYLITLSEIFLKKIAKFHLAIIL
jgi:hypothetical protein